MTKISYEYLSISLLVICALLLTFIIADNLKSTTSWSVDVATIMFKSCTEKSEEKCMKIGSLSEDLKTNIFSFVDLYTSEKFTFRINEVQLLALPKKAIDFYKK